MLFLTWLILNVCDIIHTFKYYFVVVTNISFHGTIQFRVKKGSNVMQDKMVKG